MFLPALFTGTTHELEIMTQSALFSSHRMILKESGLKWADRCIHLKPSLLAANTAQAVKLRICRVASFLSFSTNWKISINSSETHACLSWALPTAVSKSLCSLFYSQQKVRKVSGATLAGGRMGYHVLSSGQE